MQDEFKTNIIYFSRCLLAYLLRNAMSVSLRHFGGLETHPASDSLAESSSSVDMCCLVKLAKARDSFSSFTKFLLLSYF